RPLPRRASPRRSCRVSGGNKRRARAFCVYLVLSGCWMILRDPASSHSVDGNRDTVRKRRLLAKVPCGFHGGSSATFIATHPPSLSALVDKPPRSGAGREIRACEEFLGAGESGLLCPRPEIRDANFD